MRLNKPAIFIAPLLTLLYFRTFIWLLNSWLTEPYYSHGFLIPLISAFILWRNIHEFKERPREGTSNPEADLESEPLPFKPGIFIFAFGLILYIIGFLTIFPFLSALSFLFTTSGLILYFYGKPLMRASIFPIAFLIFAFPMPSLYFEKAAYTMQALSARYPAALLHLLGIPVTRVGAEIHVTDSSFVIGLPCSGMNSLISLLALAALFIYLLHCPRYKKALLLCLAVPIALLANILRVTALLLIAHAYGAETASGFFHTLFSPLLFILAVIFLILMSVVMRCKVKGG
ncbi:MAG: exosortase/archaeosortase family protein [Methanosarcinales archaeon]|nr:exosortase/archaeosortase family protein [Methanosarcinales archaeon]